MKDLLKNKTVAVLVADGFEESEFTQPVEALKNSGATVHVVSLKEGPVRAWAKTDWGNNYDVDVLVHNVTAQDYDALVLPGGVMNPDKLRADSNAVVFVGGFFDDNKPIAAICHGPWTLIETGELRGRTLTSYASIQTDLKNAGARWVDEEVVEDNGLVTSRSPKDLPAFCKTMLAVFAKGNP